MFRKIKEFLSLQQAKNPGTVIMLYIAMINVVLFFAGAGIIYYLAPEALAGCSFWDTLFYTITMVLDAGCVQFIVLNAADTSAVVIVVCLLVILCGMILFTGAVIGGVTNYISHFIEVNNKGRNQLKMSDHTIILNWNSRASEIINDLLYSENPEKVVILVDHSREKIEKEIATRVAETIERENKELMVAYRDKGFWENVQAYRKKRLRNRLTVIVREGDTYSTKQLMDISIEQAKSIIILGKDVVNNVCKYDVQERKDRNTEGDADIIKTLVQVADLTSSLESADNQRIVVEAEDDWTLSIIEKIIKHKENHSKCVIIPVAVNRMLGQILSQFSIMPELNMVYQTLFSNKGAAFYCEKKEIPANENAFFREYFRTHREAVPLGFLDSKNGSNLYYMADSQQSVSKTCSNAPGTINLKLKKFQMPQKNVIILGHNSKSHYIMEGFNSFRDEWNPKDGPEIMDIMVIDDEDSLKRQNYFSDYEQVTETHAYNIYQRDEILEKINDFVDRHEEDVSILILSDDHALAEDLDGTALIYLIYVQEIIQEHLAKNPNFDIGKIDVIVEILNPKNSDVVSNYSKNNVVISNRYVSKMMTQLAEKEELFDFYNDILTYDEAGADTNGYDSKEVYAKIVEDFFAQIPGEITAGGLIRSVYNACPEDNKHLVLGYVTTDAQQNPEIHLFDGNQQAQNVTLKPKDKLIVYTNH